MHPLKAAISQRKLKVFWSGVPWWVDCSMRDAFPVKVDCATGCFLEILLCMLDFLRLSRSNNIHGCGLL